jgi:hypothetical protein
MSHVHIIGGYTTAIEYQEHLLQMKAARESERDKIERRKARLRVSEFTGNPDRNRGGHSGSESNAENEFGSDEEADRGPTGGSLGSYA